MIASESECSAEIWAAVSKEHADHLYPNQPKEAMNEYKNTIGYVAPSYVIEKYLEVTNLQLLIDYLERLIDTPVTSQNHMFGNNKDYTALLLNCYIKE